MAKVCILGDTHFGARSGSSVLHNYFERFYENVFFPYLEKHGITKVYQLGDLFDKKKTIDFYTLDRCRKYFFDPAAKRGIDIVCNVGNHDILLKNSCEINAPRLLTTEYDNVTVYDKPCEIEADDTSFVILPWICQDNQEEVAELLNSSRSTILLGHLELAGFCMYRGLPSAHGMSATTFDRFDMVLSGHYHHRSTNGHIWYVGTPYELTWSDSEDPRGFHILDTETRELTFIENPYTLFNKIVYDDTDMTFEDVLAIDVSKYRDTYVKIVVKEKTSEHAFDAFVKHVEQAGAVDVKVTENQIELVIGDPEELGEIDDTSTLLQQAVEETEMTIDKDKLAAFLHKLYIEASNLESA